MDRQQQLQYCRVCKHKAFDLKKGIVCGLTGKVADFESTCPHFSETVVKAYREQKEDDISIRELLRFFGGAIRLRFFVTPILIIGCFVMYFMSLKNSPFIIVPTDARLIELGALAKSLTINGEYWRLITYQFLHGDPTHIMANIIGLFPIGFLLERVIGSLRMLIAFLLSGIAAGAFSILFDDLGMTVGASGSILGVYGVYIMLLTTKIMDRKTRLIILVGLAAYIVLTLIGSMAAEIDFAAHAGGIIGGLLLGLGMRFRYVVPHRRLFHFGLTAFASVLLLGASAGIVLSSPDTENRYDARMKEFFINEQEARRMMEEYAPRNVNLYVSIVNKSIVPTWQKCSRILSESLEIEGITGDMVAHTRLMMDYCKLNAKWCQLNACSRMIGHNDHKIMMQYCETLLNDLLTIAMDTTASDSLHFENSFDALLADLPSDRPIIIDGQPVPDRSQLNVLDPLEIVTIRILHKSMASRMYGEFGRKGVIEMKTLGKIRDDVTRMPEGPEKDQLMKLYAMKP